MARFHRTAALAQSRHSPRPGLYEGAFSRAGRTPDSAGSTGAAAAFGNLATAGTPGLQTAAGAAKPKLANPENIFRKNY